MTDPSIALVKAITPKGKAYVAKVENGAFSLDVPTNQGFVMSFVGKNGKAVANLKRYTKVHGAFLATATGLPTLAVQNDLLGHVLELKNQLDAYAKGDYAKSTALYRDAYHHMFMTGDLLAGAIAKQKNLK